jgi:hypothetical protein
VAHSVDLQCANIVLLAASSTSAVRNTVPRLFGHCGGTTHATCSFCLCFDCLVLEVGANGRSESPEFSSQDRRRLVLDVVDGRVRMNPGANERMKVRQDVEEILNLVVVGQREEASERRHGALKKDESMERHGRNIHTFRTCSMYCPEIFFISETLSMKCRMVPLPKIENTRNLPGFMSTNSAS